MISDSLAKTLNQILDRIDKFEERFIILEEKFTEKTTVRTASKQAKTKIKKR